MEKERREKGEKQKEVNENMKGNNHQRKMMIEKKNNDER